MYNFIGSVRFALRIFRKNPGSTALALVALTLGIGLVTSMFTVLHGIVLSGLPFPHSERLVQVERTHPAREDWWNGITYEDFQVIRESTQSFDYLGASTVGTMNISEEGMIPVRHSGAWISWNFTKQLEVSPILGRALEESDDIPGAAPVVLLGEQLWRTRYNSDPAVLGQTVRINGEDTTIVGVMPAGFEFPNSQELWVPIHRNPQFVGPNWAAQAFGRLREGVTIGQAQAELDSLFPRLLETSNDPNKERPLRIRDLHSTFLGNDFPRQLYTMMGAVVFVLLIACGNVANLQLARAITRSRELAIRASLGAPRLELVMQLLIESVMLAGAGAIGGIILSRFTVAWFASMMETQFPPPPYWYNFSFDWRIAGFTASIAVIAGIVSGLIPAWKATRPDVQETLKENARGSSSAHAGRFARGLVITQVALTCALLIGAGLMIKTMVMMGTDHMPYDASRIFGARIGLFDADYPEPDQRRQFFTNLMRESENLPGVQAAAVSNRLLHFPSNGAPYEEWERSYERADERPRARWESISAGYFSTLGVPMIEGREFTATDLEDSAVAIVNTTFAEAVWPNESAIGKRFMPDFQLVEVENQWLTVVGIAPDLRMIGFQDINEDGRGFYVPYHTQTDRFMTILLCTDGDPMSLVEPVRRAVQRLDANLPIYFPNTMQGYIENAMAFRRLVANLFALFGIAAITLASIGIYGVMSASVNQRVLEIGVRMALGAKTRDIVGMVLRQGAWQLTVGVTVGIIVALALTRVMATLLYNVHTRDAQIFVLVPSALVAVAVFSCLMPARKAARVHPLEALRSE